ncbi:MAG TPA: ubiquinol-cytochrome c reductase iron-sulfur subunit [Candidatus Acidoferrales bacterium]|nr:ubiquinol-cytochrome c reductase iron-sulfur subunit [Candidatus Acidoferrales bacterium]
MAEHVAKAYLDPGTPQEQSRRQFLATATVAVGNVIGVVLAVPLVVSLIPQSLIEPNTAGGQWTPISDDDLKALEAATQAPVKISFTFKAKDGYLESDDTEYVWGVKLTPEEVASFRSTRPDLFSDDGKVDYPAVNMGFVIFSSICPHLGCRFNWIDAEKRFMCPCHGSQFGLEGQYLAGPAPRGLDPLPFREVNGTAQVTWIEYRSQQPSRVIISYT